VPESTHFHCRLKALFSMNVKGRCQIHLHSSSGLYRSCCTKRPAGNPRNFGDDNRNKSGETGFRRTAYVHRQSFGSRPPAAPSLPVKASSNTIPPTARPPSESAPPTLRSHTQARSRCGQRSLVISERHQPIAYTSHARGATLKSVTGSAIVVQHFP